MRKLLTFMLLAAALVSGATQTALAEDGWFNGAQVELVFANANGELRIRTNPRPQNAEGANFGCTQSTLILGFSNASDNDDEGLAGLWDIVATANLTGASVDMYLDEVSNGTRVDCYVNRLQANLPASTPNPPAPNPPAPNPPNPNPPNPSTRNYYGAFAAYLFVSSGPYGSVIERALGYSTDAVTIEEADAIAWNRCGDTRCRVIERFGNGECLVVYERDNGEDFYYIVPRSGLNDAIEAALGVCETDASVGCRRVITDCNSGTYSGNAPPIEIKALRPSAG